MNGIKILLSVLVVYSLVTVFSCDEALLTPRGQWNPEDPDYEKTTDPDYTDERTPRMPVDFAAEAVSHEQVDLSWTDNADNEDGCIVERKISGEDEFTELDRTDGDIEAWSDTSVSPLTDYVYRVCSYNSYGSSEYAAAVPVSVPQAPGSPDAPSGLSASAASDTAVDLSWTDNADDETSFKVERSEDGVDYTQAVLLDGADYTSWQDTGLTPSTTYYYRVLTGNTYGFSGYSNVAEVITLGPPAAPTSLSATTVDDGRIDLSWTDNAVNELSFRVERNSGGGYSPVAYPNADETSYSDTGLTQNTTYTYRVIAHNDYGDSDPSNEDSATTQGVPTEAPSGLTATVYSANEIRLAWTDNSSNETGFLVEYLSGSWLEATTTAAGATSYNHQGLDTDSAYTYRVTAVNTYGQAGPSNTDSDTTYNWSIDDVLSTGQAGSHSSVDFDSSGNPHIAYINGSSNTLYYTYWNGIAWSVPEPVDSNGSNGWYVSLKIDSSNRPQVAYIESGGHDLRWAIKISGTWTVMDVDTAHWVDYDLDLAVDSADMPYISYTARGDSYTTRYGEGDLCLAWYDGSWNTQTLDNTITEIGRDNAITLDSGGTIHIAYEYSGRIYYTWGTAGGGTWLTNREQVYDTGYGPDLVLDSSGNVHVCYYDRAVRNLMYAKRDGSWSTPINLDTEGYTGYSPKIDVDSADNPHICYIYSDDKDLKYAAYDGSAWTVITVDSTVDLSSAIMIDMLMNSDNEPCVVYSDYTTKELKYAEKN